MWIENRGQWPEDIRFLAQFPGKILRLECGAIGIQLIDPDSPGGSYARIVFEDGDRGATPIGLNPGDATFSFFVGRGPEGWQAAVPGYSQAAYTSIHDGLGLVLRTECGRPMYDAARASNLIPSDPLVRFECPDLHQAGNAVSVPLSTAWALAMAAPSSLMSRATLASAPNGPGGSASLQPSSPGLLWSTYLGSWDSQGLGTRADRAAWSDAGELAVAGITDLLGFPQTPGAYQGVTGSSGLMFLVKFRGRDGALIYSSLLGGGPGYVYVQDLALDSVGRATVVGNTIASNYPTTPGSFDPVRTNQYGDAGFVTQLSATGGALEYATFLESEGDGSVLVNAIAPHPDGGVVIAGGALPGIFPTTQGAFQSVFHGQTGDAFVGRLNAAGSAFHWLTLLGGNRWQSARDVALTNDGRPVVLAWTASRDFPTTPGAFQPTLGNGITRATVVTAFNPGASALDWSTFVAGGSQGEFDEPWNLALDGDDCVFVAGTTNDPAFPVTLGAFQTVRPPGGFNIRTGFVLRLDPAGSSLLYSTLITGTLGGGAGSINVDPSGVATLGGGGQLLFPTTPGAYDSSPLFNGQISFLRLAPHGDRLYYFTHVGGWGSDTGEGITSNSRGRVALVGSSTGGYPTTPSAVQPNYAAGQSNAVVTTMDLLLRGVQQFGESTSSCRGVLQMNTSEMPAAGAATFGVWCSGAPPSARGMLVFGSPRSAPAFVGGAQLWIDLSRPTTRIPVVADSHGFVETTIPLPATAAGRKVAAQYLFRNSVACGTGRGACSSNGLLIEVQ